MGECRLCHTITIDRLILSPSSLRDLLIISPNESYWFMSRDKLVELQNIVNEKIGALKEEVEIGTNVKLNVLSISDVDLMVDLAVAVT